jgi:hypothetical protein
LARVVGLVLVVSTAVVAGMTFSAGSGRHDQHARVRLAVRIRPPTSSVSVLAGAPDAVAAGVALRLFASAPVIIVASPERPGDMAAAVGQSLRAHAPLLLTSGGEGLAASGTRRRHPRQRATWCCWCAAVTRGPRNWPLSPAHEWPARG